MGIEFGRSCTFKITRTFRRGDFAEAIGCAVRGIIIDENVLVTVFSQLFDLNPNRLVDRFDIFLFVETGSHHANQRTFVFRRVRARKPAESTDSVWRKPCGAWPDCFGATTGAARTCVRGPLVGAGRHRGPTPRAPAKCPEHNVQERRWDRAILRCGLPISSWRRWRLLSPDRQWKPHRRNRRCTLYPILLEAESSTARWPSRPHAGTNGKRPRLLDLDRHVLERIGQEIPDGEVLVERQVRSDEGKSSRNFTLQPRTLGRQGAEQLGCSFSLCVCRIRILNTWSAGIVLGDEPAFPEAVDRQLRRNLSADSFHTLRGVCQRVASPIHDRVEQLPRRQRA